MKVAKLTRSVRKVLPLKYTGAVIVAAGSASRMQGIDKVMACIGGEPMIVRTIRAFQTCDAIREIVIVTRQDLISQVSQLCASFDKVRTVVAGGNSREESVQSGIQALSKKVKLIAVHDGARPFVTHQLIDRCVRAAHSYHAAAPGIPVKDTIKVTAGGMVISTPDRNRLQAIQTPQVFDSDLLRCALHNVKDNKLQITDDCSAVEQLGMSIRIVQGDERNIKITTPMDLKVAQLLLEEME